MPVVLSVNVARATPNPYKPQLRTGIDKRPAATPVQLRRPGPKRTGLGSGLVGDFLGDRVDHGGDDQAVYAFAREDLDRWQQRLGAELENGLFGENLTTAGLDLADARIGEIWQVGERARLRVCAPRIPCSTFRGWMDRTGWLKTFTADGRPGAYLGIVREGSLASGQSIAVVHRPAHEVSVAVAFRALTTEPDLKALVRTAGGDLGDELRRSVAG